MNRREFLGRAAALGGWAGLGAIVQACAGDPTTDDGPSTRPAATGAGGPGEPTASPPAVDVGPTPAAPTPSGGASAVALVATSDRMDGVRRAISLAGGLDVRGRSVLVKPNLNSAHAAPGSTHPDVLEAILSVLVDGSAGAVTVADRSGMGSTADVMAQTGVLELASRFGFRAQALDELRDDAYRLVRVPGHHWSRGYPVPRLLADAERVIQACNLKTHRHGGHFTLSLKNSIGLVAKRFAGHDFMAELHDSPAQRSMIAEANTAYDPHLVVVDGVAAFVRGGPDTGVRRDTGVVLAGADRVAVDAVGVAILRLFGTTPEVSRGAIFDQEQIARAADLGLGATHASAVEIVTADPASEAYAADVRRILYA